MPDCPPRDALAGAPRTFGGERGPSGRPRGAQGRLGASASTLTTGRAQLDTSSEAALRDSRRFSLGANVRIHANDRQGLEQLCRYGARGAISLERLEERPDGRLSYRMRRPAPDGSTHFVLTPLALLKKLAALIPAWRSRNFLTFKSLNRKWGRLRMPRRSAGLRDSTGLRCSSGFSKLKFCVVPVAARE